MKGDANRLAERAGRSGPLKVGVLITLEWRPDAGGHVKTWERLARAALAHPSALDLTVHMLGPSPDTHVLGANVRYRIHRPVFGTGRLPFLSQAPAHTDLAPWHPGLVPLLSGYDVVHTTDAFFSFARTAAKVCRRRHILLVDSIHTETPRYQRVFADRIVRRLVGGGVLARLLLDRLRIAERVEARAFRVLARHHAGCAYVFVSTEDERRRAAAVQPAGRIGVLGRGVDKDRFHPRHRDRVWLEREFGVPSGHAAVLAVGRMDPSKNILLLAEAMDLLAAEGAPVHLVCAGDGADRAAVRDRLGRRVTCPGNLPPETLERLYASADIMAFPSVLDVFGNAPVEAMTAGLPVLVSAAGGMDRILVDGESGIVVPADTPRAWAAALAGLAADETRRAAIGRAARSHAEACFPSWDDILTGSLLPVWRRVAEEAPTGRLAAGQ